eukprot:GHVR01045001.1.p1 GENE.GHVR01045001.1~~GHVR01045001.1.p1  ORF type:complete len:167 (+),score=13.05 GHVR01045001.1:508-1008(+)
MFFSYFFNISLFFLIENVSAVKFFDQISSDLMDKPLSLESLRMKFNYDELNNSRTLNSFKVNMFGYQTRCVFDNSSKHITMKVKENYANRTIGIAFGCKRDEKQAKIGKLEYDCSSDYFPYRVVRLVLVDWADETTHPIHFLLSSSDQVDCTIGTKASSNLFFSKG